MGDLPRAAFLPDVIWPFEADGRVVAVDRRAAPAAWRAAAESEAPIVTQWDDGAHRGDGPGRTPTSSASAPCVVAGMLADLDARPGMRVLEIGTGTGWNAGLLAHRLGDDNVVTVEVDPAVAADARRALARAGRRPRVVTGDGVLGAPDGAPYDRLVATCGTRRLPAEWLEQTRPGGVLLVPWGTDYCPHDALVRLTVAADGTARGPFLRLVEFMKLRAQRFTWPTFPADLPIRDTTAPGAPPAHGPWRPFTFVAGLCLRDAAHAVERHDDGHTLWLYSLRGDSWTAAVHRAGTGGRDTVVRQAGPRRLWDELVAAHAWWTAHGEPGVDRFGLTVTPDGATPWLDDPGQPVPGR